MGIGISANSEEYEFYETLNGGQNWTKRLNAGREFGIIPLNLDFFNKKGIITCFNQTDSIIPYIHAFTVWTIRDGMVYLIS
jgi:hypothetical protein